jgi:hypothetical protein
MKLANVKQKENENKCWRSYKKKTSRPESEDREERKKCLKTEGKQLKIEGSIYNKEIQYKAKKRK